VFLSCVGREKTNTENHWLADMCKTIRHLFVPSFVCVGEFLIIQMTKLID